MQRFLLLVIALITVGAACSGGAETDDADAAADSSVITQAALPETSAAPETTATPETTVAAEESTTTTSAPAVEVEGPPASDFTLALDGGGEFTLSAEQKPVYMIFWAEW